MPKVLNRSINTSYQNTVSGDWNISAVSNAVGSIRDNLLEPNEQFVIQAYLPSGENLTVNTEFNLEIKPSVGTSLAIKRKGPNKIYKVNMLY